MEKQEAIVGQEHAEEQVSMEEHGNVEEQEGMREQESIENHEVIESTGNKYKKIIKGTIICVCALLGIYLGMSIYFISHFYFGTEINGVNVSGKSVDKAKELMVSQLNTYTLNLKERGNKEEQIKAVEIGLKYDPEGQFENFKDKQHPLKWISAFFYTEELKMTADASYDEKLLKERVDKLSCFDKNNIIEPKNASFKYSSNGYVIVDEVNGNKVNKDILYNHVSNAILKREASVDLEAIDCYYKPLYTIKSQKTAEVRDILNKYTSSKIIYNFGEHKEILDGLIINNWIIVDDNLGINIDEQKVKKFIDELSNKYITTGKIINFGASSGKKININGGDYDWLIDTAKETGEIVALIKEGKTVAKDPSYTQTAYVEIDLTMQHLWFYKNGSLIAQGDIVSGDVASGMATPEGVYKLKYKARNAVLRGPGYAAPVDFWMPFNGGIGIHDATWRSRFGGTIYKYDGSHGCINCPYSLAQAIFNNIDEGTPVICYY